MPCRAIKALLLAGNVTFEDKVLDIFKEEHKSPEMLKLNPSGTVPFVTIDGKGYSESQAILRLLCQVCPELRRFYPDDPFMRHKIDALLDFNGTSFRPASLKPLQVRFEMK